MQSIKKNLRIGSAILSTLLAAVASSAAIAADFRDSPDASATFLRLRCTLDAKAQVYSWWTGTMYAREPGKVIKPLMGFEGYNVCRVVKQEDGSYQMLTREVTYYRDLKSGKIIEQWDNPYTGKTLDVMQVHNDPVNSAMPAAGKSKYPMPWKVVDDVAMVLIDVPLDYPNALSPTAFPEESTGDRYIASEHFGFFAKLADMNNPKLNNVPYVNSWFRTGPWLPWMKMGQREGGLVYSGEGKKLAGGFSDLPAEVQAYTRAHFPKFVDAPTEFVKPNETSWTVYRKMKEEQSPAEPAAVKPDKKNTSQQP